MGGSASIPLSLTIMAVALSGWFTGTRARRLVYSASLAAVGSGGSSTRTPRPLPRSRVRVGATVGSLALCPCEAGVDGKVELLQLETLAAKTLGPGDGRARLRADVDAQVRLISDYGKAHSKAGSGAAARTGPTPLHVPLGRATFPQIVATLTVGLKVIDHADNVDHMLKRYGIGYRYNVVRKAIEWSHPELSPSGR